MESKYTQKQLDILKTTINYISKNGIQSFSLRNIAEEVGIKQPTLYGHFKNKEEILKGVFDLYKTDITNYHNSLMKLNTTKLTKIRMYFKKMCEFIQYKPDYMNLVTFELYQHRDLFRDELCFICQSMQHIVDKASEDNDVIDNIDYPWLILTIEGLLHVYLKSKLLDEKFDVLGNADNYWDHVEKLLKK